MNDVVGISKDKSVKIRLWYSWKPRISTEDPWHGDIASWTQKDLTDPGCKKWFSLIHRPTKRTNVPVAIESERLTTKAYSLKDKSRIWSMIKSGGNLFSTRSSVSLNPAQKLGAEIVSFSMFRCNKKGSISRAARDQRGKENNAGRRR